MISEEHTSRIRTKDIIGRQELLEELRSYLEDRGERHFVYIYGEGGVGKTRVLQALQSIVGKAGEEVYSTGIIDLFHTDTHGTSDIERTIIEALDPHHRYFRKYRSAREHYELVRERGTDPQILETQRKQLSQFFVDGCRQMALDARKLVLLFDTVELLQYESSIVEEVAGLDTVDARIKVWLLNNLSQLGNVLVVFAGRPKKPAPGELSDPQKRLLEDMGRAFGKDFVPHLLPALTVEETRELVNVLVGAEPAVKQDLETLIPVVHLLTGGRPVYIHMVIDLLFMLPGNPKTVLDLFRKHTGLLDTPKDADAIKSAQDEVQDAITHAIFNDTTRYGWYLNRLALMPKGVDAEILTETAGVPRKEAEELLGELDSLSFIKVYEPPAEGRTDREVLPGRIFLHDELYRMLRSKIIPNWRYMELQVAYSLVKNYYDRHIKDLQDRIDLLPDPQSRIPLRERMQKLQVERLYYLLVHDAAKGYQEYKQLTQDANWWRWVGYSNRLLDEFLRYYNDPERRKEFERKGITEAKVIQESAALWADRFFWWGQYRRCVDFSDQVLKEHPELIPEGDLVTRANIAARRLDSLTILQGYSESDIAEARALLDRLPPLLKCSPEEMLARARLSADIGYQFQQGGLLDESIAYYKEAKTAFNELAEHTTAYQGELAIWLHALAFVYARQGRMPLANPLAHEALRINEALRFEYNIGLTLSALSGIERMGGDYNNAVRHAEEALLIFQGLEDVHGITLTYSAMVKAKRKQAKVLLEHGRKLDEAQHILEKECLQRIDSGILIARENQLASLSDLLAERGRICRELGHVLRRRSGLNEALSYYHDAAATFREVLGKESSDLPPIEESDIRQDLAEVLYFARDKDGAEAELTRVRTLIGDEYIIRPGTYTPARGLPVDRFAPLGKVEQLRGQMVFTSEPKTLDEAELADGLKHYVLAYAYFLRFSEEAIQRDAMVEHIYNYMIPLPASTRRRVMSAVEAWVDDPGLDVDVSPFIEVLKTLLT